MSNCKLCLADCAFSGKDMKKGTCKGYIPMTNSDRIRAMSDEELASALVEYAGTDRRPTPYGGHERVFHGPNGEPCGTREYAVELWAEWLRQPAKEDT